MAKKDPRIDAYIAEAAPWARPVLKRLRKVIHAACPDVVETMKWSNPSFEHNGLLCGLADHQPAPHPARHRGHPVGGEHLAHLFDETTFAIGHGSTLRRSELSVNTERSVLSDR